MMTDLREPLEDPLGAVHVGWGPHQEAHMEGCLPHCAPVLHVPAVLGEQLGVGLHSLSLQYCISLFYNNNYYFYSNFYNNYLHQTI